MLLEFRTFSCERGLMMLNSINLVMTSENYSLQSSLTSLTPFRLLEPKKPWRPIACVCLNGDHSCTSSDAFPKRRTPLGSFVLLTNLEKITGMITSNNPGVPPWPSSWATGRCRAICHSYTDL